MDEHLYNILLIDANAEELSHFRNALTQQQRYHYTVTEVNSMELGLKACQANSPFDCIVLATMGDKHFNSQSVELLQQHYRENLPPILLITKQEKESEAAALLHNGIQDYLLQPQVTDNSLCRCVQHSIEKNHLEKKVLQQSVSLDRLTYHDPITNLPNRLLFENTLVQTIARSKRFDRMMALLMIDIDHFKSANDTFGHRKGDLLLTEIAERLEPCIRENDFVARLGGDEFAIILDEIEQFMGAGIFAERVKEALAPAFYIDNQKIFLTASIGIACLPSAGESADDLIKNADVAMFRTKEQGGDGYQYFSPELNEKLTSFLNIKNNLHEAINKQQFYLLYQPKVNTKSGKICGLEALIRWQKDTGTTIMPVEFIPVAEKLGLIIPIGYWVIDRACLDIKHWMSAGIKMRIAINVSARQLLEQDFIEQVEKITNKHQVPSHLIELELTESVIMQNMRQTLRVLHKLQKLGYHITVDDFGTGYSSLSYLKRLPIKTLKIDRAFIKRVVKSQEDQAIIKSILTLCRALKLHVVAEGIEDKQQYDLLRTLGCEQVQGYYISKPTDIATIMKLIKKYGICSSKKN